MGKAKIEMLNIRKKLIEADRENALRALMTYIHYKVAPNVPPREHGVDTQPVVLFESSSALFEFIAEHELQESALEWVFGDLKSSNSLERENGKVSLSRNGVNEFCRD